MTKRIVSLWFKDLSIERVSRHSLVDKPFVLYEYVRNTDRIYALNKVAQNSGLTVGMGLGDARVLCPSLLVTPADIKADARFLKTLARLAQKFCPWVGLDGVDGLLLDMTGSTHLWGGEESFIKQAKAYYFSFGLSVKIGVASNIGTAWALSHFKEGRSHDCHSSLQNLPIEALRLRNTDIIILKRLGLNQIGMLYELPRAELTRRLGQEVLLRLDQACGTQAESISPISPQRIFATRMKFPEPIGLFDDVMKAISRLLEPLCAKLNNHNLTAHKLIITLARVDNSNERVSIRFARPLLNAKTILPLINYHIERVHAGFGFDAIRLEALDIDYRTAKTMAINAYAQDYDDLLTRIGNRIGFENIRKQVFRDSHVPEKSVAMVRYDAGEMEKIAIPANRPLQIFSPKMIVARGIKPPKRFTWRSMKFHTMNAVGPERIAPEWWGEGEDLRLGVRDYWRIATREGPRLWLFYTPQKPAWYVQGMFP